MRRLGRYRLLRSIGRNATAESYVAGPLEPTGVEPMVVVSLIHSDLLRDDWLIDLVLAEAQLASRLDHPAIVRIHGAGVDGDAIFVVSELVDGFDLAALLRARKHRIAAGDAVRICRFVLDGLDHAHTLRSPKGRRLRIVHCDIAPSNVVVCRTGEVKIAGFGLSLVELMRKEALPGRGAHAFMAPERARGEAVDHRCDVFSAGALLHWMVTGGPPLVASGGGYPRDLRVRWYGSARRGGSDLPAELERVILRATSPLPEARYQTASEMRSALEAARRSMGLDSSAEALSELTSSSVPAAADLRGARPSVPDGFVGGL